MRDFFLPAGYSSSENLTISDSSVIILGLSDEERCIEIIGQLQGTASEIIYLEQINDNSFKLINQLGNEFIIKNRGQDDEKDLIAYISQDNIYIDITSIEVFQIPRLVAILKDKFNLRAIYAEPLYYENSNSDDIEGEYNLYETNAQIKQLLGYSIIRPEREYSFVPFLGFQGSRLTYMQEQIQPLESNTHPIIGSPGYALEYPLVAITENRRIFDSIKIARNIDFSPSLCPFMAYRLLKRIFNESNKPMTIGLLGTKPQSLGAIIFAIKNPRNCELLYDFPKKRLENFRGVGLYHTYYITEMWEIIDNVA